MISILKGKESCIPKKNGVDIHLICCILLTIKKSLSFNLFKVLYTFLLVGIIIIVIIIIIIGHKEVVTTITFLSSLNAHGFVISGGSTESMSRKKLTSTTGM